MIQKGLQNRLRNTKDPKPFKTWDADTGGGTAESRTRVRRSSPSGAYSLGVIKVLSHGDHVAEAIRRGLGFSRGLGSAKPARHHLYMALVHAQGEKAWGACSSRVAGTHLGVL